MVHEVYRSQRLQLKKTNCTNFNLADEDFPPLASPHCEAHLAKENFDEAASAAKDRRAIWKAKGADDFPNR